jgi:predicted nucleotidyltransferase
MSNELIESNLEKIAALLLRHGVEFIVIGGQAEYIFGSPRITYDVDLCYSREKPNLERLAAALKELGVTLRGAPRDLPIILDAKALEFGSNYTFDTPRQGALDILGYVEPIGGFDQVNAKAANWKVGELNLRVIDLDDLIRIKQHINRPKDRESLYQLLAIKRLREETGQR